ncbi:response regulator [Sphingobacterium thalpophilum]|uniref:Chemotaxis protein CheY homolog n=1 Tax=Sphingobacterium thalpophilum TaxID=259 RepID=A0A4U9UG16_9SPHI|nr:MULTISPECIES: response regulator [Sphingobacterium]MCW8310522.1 response regulator [Sphingobacterium sp. InxBP1]VTR31723.1 Chemotaxis protein CheY homolog [Sphingobacterium thalpophilum]
MNRNNKRKIILIDDNAILRTIFGHMIRGFSGYEIEFHAFKDALDFLEQADIIGPSDTPILFVDINMPFMTGWELMDRLEDNTDFINRSKIYIISSSSSKSDQDQLANYPFISGFVLKPFDKDLLYEILQKY